MFSHVMVGSDDIAASRTFYDALFAVLGAGPAKTDAKGRLLYMKDDALFMVSNPIDGQTATHANGGRSASMSPRRRSSMRGMPPVSPMAADRSRTRRACAKTP